MMLEISPKKRQVKTMVALILLTFIMKKSANYLVSTLMLYWNGRSDWSGSGVFWQSLERQGLQEERKIDVFGTIYCLDDNEGRNDRIRVRL